MCQPRMAPRFSGQEGCACGCCGCGCGPRSQQFFAPHSEHERLKNYRDQLKRELAGVAERIEKCDCS